MTKLPPKCEQCGWKWGGFHICLELPKAELQKVRPLTKQPRAGRPMSDSTREAISESQKARWDAYRERMRPKYDEIVRRYNQGGIGINRLADEVGVGRNVVMRALQEAQDEGRTVIRRRGVNVAYSKN